MKIVESRWKRELKSEASGPMLEGWSCMKMKLYDEHFRSREFFLRMKMELLESRKRKV